MRSKVNLALFQWSSSFFLHLQNDFLTYREQKMTFMKCIIVILVFLVSRVVGAVSTHEDTSSRDRIESVSRNFEKYWITSKGRNKNWWEYWLFYMANRFFSDRVPKIPSQVATGGTAMLLKPKWLRWMSLSITRLQMSKLLRFVKVIQVVLFVFHNFIIKQTKICILDIGRIGSWRILGINASQDMKRLILNLVNRISFVENRVDDIYPYGGISMGRWIYG